jgi:hypothetical protein
MTPFAELNGQLAGDELYFSRRLGEIGQLTDGHHVLP